MTKLTDDNINHIHELVTHIVEIVRMHTPDHTGVGVEQMIELNLITVIQHVIEEREKTINALVKELDKLRYELQIQEIKCPK